MKIMQNMYMKKKIETTERKTLRKIYKGNKKTI